MSPQVLNKVMAEYDKWRSELQLKDCQINFSVFLLIRGHQQ